MPLSAMAPLSISTTFWSRPDVVTALADHDFGALFGLLRKYAGASQTRLGTATGLAQSAISDVMTGKRRVTSAQVVARIADGLKMPDAARARLGLAAAVPELASLTVDRAVTEGAVGNALTVHPLSGHAWLNNGDHRFSAAAWPQLSPVGPSVSSAELEQLLVHLGEIWHGLVRSDNLLGPRHTLAAVHAQLTVLTQLLYFARDAQRVEALRLAAMFAESASWLYEDADSPFHAQHWIARATEWATEGCHRDLLAWALYRQSQQATNRDRAIALASAADRYHEGDSGPMRAAVYVQQANCHAADGDERASQRLLDDAHDWAATDTTGEARDGHGAFCTAAYIEVNRARSLALLGRPADAAAMYQRAINQMPAVYRRDRAAALSEKAAAHIAAGQPDEAAVAASAALPVIEATGSLRSMRRLVRVGKSLTAYRHLSEVADFVDSIEQSH